MNREWLNYNSSHFLFISKIKAQINQAMGLRQESNSSGVILGTEYGCMEEIMLSCWFGAKSQCSGLREVQLAVMEQLCCPARKCETQPRGQANKHCSLKNSVNNSGCCWTSFHLLLKKMATSRCHRQSKRITGESFWNKAKDDGSTETAPLTISVTDTKGCKTWSREHQHHRQPRTRGGLCSVWCMYELFLEVQTLRFVFSIYSF